MELKDDLSKEITTSSKIRTCAFQIRPGSDVKSNAVTTELLALVYVYNVNSTSSIPITATLDTPKLSDADLDMVPLTL